MEWFLTVKARFAIWLMGVLRMDNEDPMATRFRTPASWRLWSL